MTAPIVKAQNRLSRTLGNSSFIVLRIDEPARFLLVKQPFDCEQTADYLSLRVLSFAWYS